MSGLEAIEAPLLRPCFESLKRAAKERKTVVDEIEEMLKAFVADAEAVSTSGSTENARSTVDSLVTRLQGFKRKLQEVSASEAADASRCKARLEHLAQLGPLQRGHTLEWNKPRLERLIAEHLLRSGCPRAAKQLADAGNLHQLLDLHIFEATARIVESLRQHDCAPALAWCEENRAKLRKSKSRLEFDLRVQEFIELVRRDERMGAVAHARKHLAPWAEHYLGDLQRAMAALALTKHTRCTAYRCVLAQAFGRGLMSCCAHGFMLLFPSARLRTAAHFAVRSTTLGMPRNLACHCQRRGDVPVATPTYLTWRYPFMPGLCRAESCSVPFRAARRTCC